MCGIVASAVHTPAPSPRSPTFPAASSAPEVLYRDDNFTVYRERANPVSSKGHLIIVFKSVTCPSLHNALRRLIFMRLFCSLHVPSLYTLVSSLPQPSPD